MIRETHIYCRAFGSGAVTTCFNDSGLSQLGFVHIMFFLCLCLQDELLILSMKYMYLHFYSFNHLLVCLR